VITDFCCFCWVHQHSPIAAIFWMLQLRMQMSYLGHYHLFAYAHSTEDVQQMAYNPRLKKLHPSPQRLSICTIFMKTHLIYMTTSEESLRVLFFTHSLTVDLVH
jgi:hypothetical protein